jgi:hypothetical protein
MLRYLTLPSLFDILTSLFSVSSVSFSFFSLSHYVVQVLSHLVDVIVTESKSTSNDSSMQLVHKQLLELMGRITCQAPSDPDLWAVYAKYWKLMGNIEKVSTLSFLILSLQLFLSLIRQRLKYLLL